MGCIKDNMAPGDTCVENVKVHNDGSVDLFYTVSDIETACFDVSHVGPFDNAHLDADGNKPGFILASNAEVETIDIEVTLSGDNACQGASDSVGISVAASTTSP